MKYIVMPGLFVLMAVSIYSCKKEAVPQNNGINGKWQLKEVFYGYFNGGDFKWHDVSFGNSHFLTFTPNGQYDKKQNGNGAYQQCSGTYILQPSNNLEVNSNCNTLTEKFFVSELTPTVLIIDQPGIEGKIKYKYTATK